MLIKWFGVVEAKETYKVLGKVMIN